MSDRKIHWRCFHCGEAFTKAQERWAREHFGRDESELPVCQMRVSGEHHLLTALRNAQDELAAYRAEDTDLMRAIYAQAADHAAALRREEERGYQKGVRDARAEAAAVTEALATIVGTTDGFYTVAMPSTLRDAAKDALRAVFGNTVFADAAPQARAAPDAELGPGSTQNPTQQKGEK